MIGGVAGAVLLLELPASAFKTIVPVFIAIALVLILTQRQLVQLIGHHRRAAHQGTPPGAVVGACAAGSMAVTSALRRGSCCWRCST